MNIKSLLLGSAAALVAATGAQAADAIVIAEPEPLEYVRICDTYGTGYFYIPGTETCLKIGGYVRYEVQYRDGDTLGGTFPGGLTVTSSDTFGKLARFAPNFTAKNATEWGTLTSYAEVEFNWASETSPNQSTNLAHAWISLENGPHTFLVGKTDTPYHAASQGGLNAGGIWGGNRGNNGDNNSGIVSYGFNAGNGFRAWLSAVENTNNSDFEPNLEAVVRYSQGWGTLVGAIGYDGEAEEWGGKVGGEIAFNPITVGLQVAYGSDPASVYGARYLDGVFSIPTVGTPTSEWAVLGYVKAALTSKLSAKASLQWFDGFSGTPIGDGWQATAGFDWKPVSGLAIIPEIRYSKADITGASDLERFDFALRFNRTF